MAKRIKAAVIGLGVGERHIHGYQLHPQCDVVAICDHNPEVLKKISVKYPDIEACLNADSILQNPDIDVVSICSYDQHHHRQVMIGLDHNKHLFVEKPVCLFPEEAIEIYKTLEIKKHLQFSSNLILRESPRFKNLRKDIETGNYGDIYHLEANYFYGRIHKIEGGWRAEAPYYSVTLGGGVHVLDLAMWVLRDRIDEVFSYANHKVADPQKFRFNDNVQSLIKFRKNTTAKIASNMGCVRPHYHGLEVYGTKQSFINDWPDAKIFKSRDPEIQPELDVSAYPGAAKGDMLKNFVDAILDSSTPLKVSKNEVFQSLAVCFAVEESIKTGQKVKVKYFDES